MWMWTRHSHSKAGRYNHSVTTQGHSRSLKWCWLPQQGVGQPAHHFEGQVLLCLISCCFLTLLQVIEIGWVKHTVLPMSSCHLPELHAAAISRVGCSQCIKYGFVAHCLLLLLLYKASLTAAAAIVIAGRCGVCSRRQLPGCLIGCSVPACNRCQASTGVLLQPELQHTRSINSHKQLHTDQRGYDNEQSALDCRPVIGIKV